MKKITTFGGRFAAGGGSADALSPPEAEHAAADKSQSPVTNLPRMRIETTIAARSLPAAHGRRAPSEEASRRHAPDVTLGVVPRGGASAGSGKLARCT